VSEGRGTLFVCCGLFECLTLFPLAAGMEMMMMIKKMDQAGIIACQEKFIASLENKHYSSFFLPIVLPSPSYNNDSDADLFVKKLRMKK
jgi:hypothetical protein